MLMPGFTVEQLPLKLSNQNTLRFGPDGTLYSLGYERAPQLIWITI